MIMIVDNFLVDDGESMALSRPDFEPNLLKAIRNIQNFSSRWIEKPKLVRRIVPKKIMKNMLEREKNGEKSFYFPIAVYKGIHPSQKEVFFGIFHISYLEKK